MEHHLCVLIVLSNPNCLVTILHPQLSIISRSNKSHPLTSSVSNVKKVALHYCHCYQLEHTSLYQFSDPRIEGKYAEGNQKKMCSRTKAVIGGAETYLDHPEFS